MQFINRNPRDKKILWRIGGWLMCGESLVASSRIIESEGLKCGAGGEVFLLICFCKIRKIK